MKIKIVFKILFYFTAFIGLFLFLPAGSFLFWEAWVYAAALFIPMVITMTYLIKNDPELLKRRMRFNEKEKTQRLIVKLFRLPFLVGFLIPGFDYRFNWSEVTPMLVIIANIMVFAGYFLVFWVFRENTYTSRIVEVEKGQRVISSGPYAVVRHPMYAGMILMFIFTPIALGSWWALIVFIFTPLVLIIRIFNEERFLLKELPGYKDYCRKIRYRLIPYVW